MRSDAIEKQRQKTVGQILKHLHEVFSTLCSSQPTCSFECSSILLGALSRQINIGLLHPWPEVPYLGYSVCDLRAKLSSLAEPDWINRNHRCPSPKPPQHRTSYSYDSPNKKAKTERPADKCECSLASLVTPTIQGLADGMTGLRLSQFPRSEI